ncbi:serine/threonine-protein kinase STY13-like [Impatiens glandulifera]|uniref:serine/threonine-protein kinase STY13-like n=1 Tax=Impatiens glandulifera TaxID=253017 RepID=UPI001FB0A343|nr:serine/threonine-protein kinase STY13-like [Impatiens glandulifera]XP_047330690.1 serine/threonine-protein kinase STY13-like [Impatiens glandulifera]XP_047330691.1 serine/threonine-protein kinase STY13-like [Impatiens glandulifera]
MEASSKEESSKGGDVSAAKKNALAGKSIGSFSDRDMFNQTDAKKKALAGKSVGSFSNKDMFFRADKIDIKDLDIGFEKMLSRAWSKEALKPKEEWEIDPSKLNLRYLVAQGTYGTVYRGTYDSQDVAVKLLDWGEDGMSTVAETTALRASFRQEVAVWQKLDHPNVTKFIGASMGTSDIKIPSKNPTSSDSNTLPSRACCVVVEYVPGGNLKKLLYSNRKKKLAFKIVIQLALDLSRGLSYLHSKKIVHRDVKAENMLLDTQRTLKIADFGVARVEAQNPQDMTGETGTLGYMAPEVLDGKPYNRKCDVYSFGICLWETYCCDLPYMDRSFADISYAVVRQNLRPEIPRCCPSSLASIMKKCWDANPEKRPDMDEVVKLLEAIDTTKGGGMIPEGEGGGCFCFAPTRGP